MMISPRFRFPLHLIAMVLAVGAMALPAVAAQAPVGQEAAATEPFEGYVVSLEGATLSASNVPIVTIGQPIQLGEDRMMFRREAPVAATGEDGKVEPETAAKAKVEPGAETKAKADPDAEAKATAAAPTTGFVADGSGAGGGTMTWTSDDAAGEGVPASEEPLQFLEFTITDDTQRPDNIQPGQKIRVHFEQRGEEKIATRIEVVETD